MGPDFVRAFLLNTMPFLVRTNNASTRNEEEDGNTDRTTLIEAAEYLAKEAVQSFKIQEAVEPASNHLSQEVADILKRLDSAGM